MGWLAEFKIGDVLSGVWEDIKKLPGDLIKIPGQTVEYVKEKTPKWVKEIDVKEFAGNVGKDFLKMVKGGAKGIGKIFQAIIGGLTPTIIILAVIAIAVLIFWKQMKKTFVK